MAPTPSVPYGPRAAASPAALDSQQRAHAFIDANESPPKPSKAIEGFNGCLVLSRSVPAVASVARGIKVV
jgi:hypothetical protein